MKKRIKKVKNDFKFISFNYNKEIVCSKIKGL